MEKTVENDDFKYVMQDTGNLYLGARYSYEELIGQEYVPFKMKAIVEQYLLKEIAPETTLESHLYYMEKGSFSYQTYEQLKLRVKVSIWQEKRGLFGRKKTGFTYKVLTLAQLCDMNLALKKKNSLKIEEIIISKFAMMTFTL